MIVQEIQTEHPEQKALPQPHTPDNYEWVKAYLVAYPTAKVREVAHALSISTSTANKWMRQVENDIPAE